MKYTFLILALFSNFLFAQEPKVILVTLDGVRWKEVFRGVEKSILNDKKYNSLIVQTNEKYWIISSDKLNPTKIFVSPDSNTNQFKINFEIKHHSDQNIFQKLTIVIPSSLTYEKSGSDYILVDAR